MMKVSDKGLLEICEHEGIVPAPYLDSQGVWTYGVGHTAAAGGLNPAKMAKGMPSDMDAALKQALEVFREDLEKYTERVNSAIKVPLKQHEFDALVSFDFNTGGIYAAELTRAINGRRQDASQLFLNWMKPPEIRKRRLAEKRLFETGDYDHNGTKIPIWGVSPTGRLQGVVGEMEGETLLRLIRPTAPAAPAPTKFSFLELLWRIFRG